MRIAGISSDNISVFQNFCGFSQRFLLIFREGELTKGEAVCLDRCVAKYLDVHEKLGKRLTSISQQDEKQLQQIQQQIQQQVK